MSEKVDWFAQNPVNLFLELFKVFLSFLCIQEVLVSHLKCLANAAGDLLCLCGTAGQFL